MEDELRPTDFVDYQVVFSGALILVGKGLAVSEALESCLRESYPLTYREMVVEARSMLARLKREREWGSLRALRELADRPGLADMMRRERTDAEGTRAAPGAAPEAIADYPRIFASPAQAQIGVLPRRLPEMAARAVSQTYRKVLGPPAST